MARAVDVERKPSGADIGALPETWRLARIGELADVKYGKANPKSKGPVPVVGSGGVFAWTDQALVDGFTIVIGRKGTAGAAQYFEGPCYPSDTTFYLAWKAKDADPLYVFYCLAGMPLSGEHAKTTLPSLQRPYLEAHLIPLPPLPEQRAIAGVLSAVRRAIEATEAVIEAAQALKKSLMRYLFTHGPVHIRGASQTPIRETEFGPIPASWQIANFGDVIEITSGQVDPREEPYASMLNLGPEDIEEGTGRILAPKTAREKGLVSGKYLFTPDQVIYSKIRPYLRKVALPLSGGICSADMYPLLPDGARLERTFLYCFLLSDAFTCQAVPHQGRTGIPKINRAQLSSTQVPLPPLDAQDQIAGILLTLDRKLDAERTKHNALQDLFKALLDGLMRGLIRVPSRSSS